MSMIDSLMLINGDLTIRDSSELKLVACCMCVQARMCMWNNEVLYSQKFH